jgi:hypothetical protein
MGEKGFITWEDDAGAPHIHFCNDNLSFEEFGNLLVSLGLATKIDDED